MSISLKSLEFFYKSSEDSYIELSESDECRVIFHFTGVLNQGFSNALTSRVELEVASEVESKQAQKRFFTVYVEVIQNILIHAEKDEDGDVHAGMTIFLKGGKLCGCFENIVEKNKGETLLKRYELVNELERPVLKEQYMDIMVNGNLSKKGGAGLGVITVVLRSKNPAEVSLSPLDDHLSIFKSTFFIDT